MIDSLPTPIAMHLAAGDPLMREDLSIAQQKAPHGMCTTLKDKVNDELLAFFKAFQTR